MLVTVFGAAMLMMVMYMIIFFSLKLWISYWTGTVHCSVCCHLVHQEETAQGKN